MTRILIPRSDNTSAKLIEASDWEKYWSNDILNDYVLTGLCLSAQCPNILAVDVAAGSGRLKGLFFCNSVSCSVTCLTVCDTNYIWATICRDPSCEPQGWILTKSLTVCVPTDSVLIGTATTNATTVTAVDNTLRETSPTVISQPGDQLYPLNVTIGCYTTPCTAVATSECAPVCKTIEYLVIGGGGSGGNNNAAAGGGEKGGGGGAGGYRTNAAHAVTAQSYSVTVGGIGGDSIFDTITSNGGGNGGGGAVGGGSGGTGGSGGGGGQANGNGGAGNQGSFCPVEGYNGASGGASNPGGGGGSSAAGSGAAGGAGTSSSITGSAVTRADGGTGGGKGSAEAANTGNGGNGGGNSGTGAGGCPGRAGGSGIVIIRYLTADFPLGVTGGCITTDGCYKVHQFLTSGTLTIVGNTAVKAVDDSLCTKWESNAEVNPAIYIDMGSAKEVAALALHFDTCTTTETEIQVRISTDATFTTPELVRTILVSDFTCGTWRFISIPRLGDDRRYIQIYGSSGASSVMAINEIKYLSVTDFDRDHYHLYLKPTSRLANSEDSD